MTTPLSPLHSGAAARLTAPAISEPLQLPLWKALGGICLLVFMEFLAMGLPLPILPSHVHETLGFGPPCLQSPGGPPPPILSAHFSPSSFPVPVNYSGLATSRSTEFSA